MTTARSARPGSETGPLAPLVARAGRRRRARRALASCAKALVPGLAAAVVLAGAWRLSGGGMFLALALAAVTAPVVAGAAVAAPFLTEDGLRAAAELDRAAGLDGLLATGLEISQGAIRTRLAPVALRSATDAARALDGTEIPLAPPAWSRYLSLPGALFVAILALPGAGPRGPSRARALPGGGAAQAGEPEAQSEAHRSRATAERSADEEREIERREMRRAVAAYKAAWRKRAELAKERGHLPAAPPLTRRLKDAGRGKADARASRGTDGGAGEAEAGASAEEAERLGGAGAGPVDLEEAPLFRERFPDYEEVIRRYFAGT